MLEIMLKQKRHSPGMAGHVELPPRKYRYAGRRSSPAPTFQSTKKSSASIVPLPADYSSPSTRPHLALTPPVAQGERGDPADRRYPHPAASRDDVANLEFESWRIRMSGPQLIQLKYFSIIRPSIPQGPSQEFC
jgi:hypothetical protein